MSDRFDENKKKLEEMAKTLRQMEKAGDYSMRGYYLDELVTNYVETFGDEFIKMFTYIIDNQKDVCASYGDYDCVVTKLKITGDIVKKDNYTDGFNYFMRAICLEDIFCGNKFIITEIVRTSKKLTTFSKSSYTVYSTDKKLKSIKAIDYNGVFSESKIFQYKKDFFEEKATLDSESNHMLFRYNKFKTAIDAIREPYLELKSETEGVEISRIINE